MMKTQPGSEAMNRSDDRVKELRKRASNYGSLPESTVNDILDDYSVLKAENERLRALNKRLSLIREDLLAEIENLRDQIT